MFTWQMSASDESNLYFDACRDFITWLATCCLSLLFWFVLVSHGSQSSARLMPKALCDFDSACLSHLDVHLLCVIILTEVAGVGSNYSAACMTCLFVSAVFHTFLTDSPPRMFPPPLPTQHAAPNPVVKLSLLNFRDSRTPSASCRAESGPPHAAEIRRLLSQMRPHVFRWCFVFFLILLWFRLSCRTLRRVQALKCD